MTTVIRRRQKTRRAEDVFPDIFGTSSMSPSGSGVLSRRLFTDSMTPVWEEALPCSHTGAFGFFTQELLK